MGTLKSDGSIDHVHTSCAHQSSKAATRTDHTRMCTYMSLAEDIEVAVSVHRGGPPLELLRCPIDRGPVSDFLST